MPNLEDVLSSLSIKSTLTLTKAAIAVAAPAAARPTPPTAFPAVLALLPIDPKPFETELNAPLVWFTAVKTIFTSF